MSLLINGSLQYKTALSWSAVGNVSASSFVLPDKCIAIVKLHHNYSVYGTSYKWITGPPPSNQETRDDLVFNNGIGMKATPYAIENTKVGIRIMRVGSTLTYTTANFTAWGATDAYGADIPTFKAVNPTYSWTLSLSGSDVTGTVTALSGSFAWDTSYDSAVYPIAAYSYQIKAFARQNAGIKFSNIQIFNSGF